jgi:hypothetical protein
MPRRLLPLLLLILPMGVALGQDLAAPAPADGTPFGAIASASPPVAVALALAWGAYQLGQTVTKVTATIERLFEKGIPIRVELTDRDRELLEQLGTGRRAPAKVA